MNKLIHVSAFVAIATAVTQCGHPEAGRDDRPPAPTAEQRSGRDTATEPTARAKEDSAEAAVRVPIDGLPAFGSPAALVTIVAFVDYECEYCAKADRRVATLRAEYGERVRLVVAPHPLPMHPHAAPAARAFLAAAEQGNGEAMHAALFEKRATLDEPSLRAAALAVGLDVDTFDRARGSRAVTDALTRAEDLARRVDATGTPTFFVNGRRVVGARPLETFRALVDEELAKAQALVASGTPAERVYAETMSRVPPPTPKAKAPKEERRVDVDLTGAPLRGPSAAPVTIVVFSDFECPFCARLEGTLRDVVAARPGKVNVAFRHRPLPMHEHARLAARAAIAAEKRGRFWEYHDALVAHQDALERPALVAYASELGLDRSFAADLDDATLDARIEADEKEAARLEVRGTPTAFVNGRRVVGAQPLSVWFDVVDRAARER